MNTDAYGRRGNQRLKSSPHHPSTVIRLQKGAKFPAGKPNESERSNRASFCRTHRRFAIYCDAHSSRHCKICMRIPMHISRAGFSSPLFLRTLSHFRSFFRERFTLFLQAASRMGSPGVNERISTHMRCLC